MHRRSNVGESPGQGPELLIPPGRLAGLRVGIDGRELAGRPTGTGRYLRNLLRVWSREGERRLFVYFDGPATADPVLRSPSIVVRPLGAGGSRGITWSERVVPGAARADGVDVFFAPAYTVPLSLDVPRVVTVHDVSFFSAVHDFGVLDGLRRRLQVAASMRAARFVLAVSDFTRREIEGLFPELSGRVVHIPHGPDDDLPQAPDRHSARAALEVKGPMILTVGTILNRRPLPTLMRAVGRLRHWWPELTLHVVGENRTRPPLDLDRVVDDAGMTGRVRLDGFVDDAALALRYAAADVAVFLSDYEGFGLPALEAMARGVPVIASRAPALGEIFGEAALLVEARDERAVSHAIERVLRDPALGADLIARGRAFAGRFSWKDTAEHTWRCLASAAGA
jgi:glycosyltransferase involved in cell wall biosynthesis